MFRKLASVVESVICPHILGSLFCFCFHLQIFVDLLNEYVNINVCPLSKLNKRFAGSICHWIVPSMEMFQLSVPQLLCQLGIQFLFLLPESYLLSQTPRPIHLFPFPCSFASSLGMLLLSRASQKTRNGFYFICIGLLGIIMGICIRT